MRYAVAILLLAIVSVPAIAEPIDPQDIRVIDGDTIRVTLSDDAKALVPA